MPNALVIFVLVLMFLALVGLFRWMIDYLDGPPVYAEAVPERPQLASSFPAGSIVNHGGKAWLVLEPADGCGDMVNLASIDTGSVVIVSGHIPLKWW